MGQHARKYNKKIVAKIPNAAPGEVFLLASMICCPVFSTSTIPIIIISDVVFIILVIRLIERGRSLLPTWGMIM
jgi:hypothetical protein